MNESCVQNTQSPLLNDPAPDVWRFNKVLQVVIGYDDAICFLCEMQQEPFMKESGEKQ